MSRSEPTSGPRPTPVLHLTGERTLPGIEDETYWFSRHVAGYRAVLDAAADVLDGDTAHAVVLDSGCGEGYGTDMLAATGATAVGLDCFADAVLHAQATYPAARFVRSDATTTPFGDASFDVVVSLQVIEHLVDPAAYVAECRRLLRPGGLFVCATPNRLTFTPPGRPKNPFHIVEFSPDELRTLLARHFGDVRMRALVDEFPGLADALIDAAFAGTPWPQWAAEQVPTVRPGHFHLTDDDCDAGLDLVATCRT